MADWRTNKDLVQKLYIAFYGRPADPGGLRNWASQLPDNAAPDSPAVRELISRFINSEEAQSRFGSPSLDAVIDRVISFAFHRDAKDADKQGVNNVVDLLVRVLTVSSGPDFATLNNKLEYANWFVDYLDPNGDGIPNDDATGTKFAATFVGNTDANNIAAKLNFIDVANPATKTMVLNDIKTVVADPGDPILTQPVASGQTFRLTLGPNTFTGTGGDDIFDGTRDANGNVTFQSFDQLDGGGGNDTLIAQGIGALTTNVNTIKNIETLHLVGATGNLDLTNTTGIKKIIQEAPFGARTVAGIAGGIERIDVIAPGASQTFTFQASAVGGNNDTLTLGIQSFGTAAKRTINLNPVSGTNGFETLNIELSGGPSGKDENFVVIDDGNATTLTTVNISGSAAGAIQFANGTTPSTINASKASGNLVINVSKEAKNINITGGDGNDEFQFGATFNTNDTVDGGEGTDTLAANAAQFAAFTTTATNISGIERIRVQDAIAGNIIDVSLFGVNYVRLEDSATGTSGTLKNLPSGSTIRFDDDAKVTLNVKGAANGKADSITLDLGEKNAGTGVIATINDVETINVTTDNAKNTANLTLTANDAAAKGYSLTVNLTGQKDLTFNLTSNHAANTVDGSGMTGALTADLTKVTGGPATVKGGSGADILIGGFGADTLTGNGGKDKFVFNNFGAADTITDFSSTADDIYIDIKNATFNAAMTPNGVKDKNIGNFRIWGFMTTGTPNKAVSANALTGMGWLTAPLGATINGTNIANAKALKANFLWQAANLMALTADIKAKIAAIGGNVDSGIAFGRVGNTLYLVYVGDTMTAAAGGTTIQAVRTIAKVGAGFTAADIFIY